MIEYLSAHASTIVLVIIGMTATAVLMAGRESISLWTQSVWHSLPLVGGIAWLARRERARQGMDRMHIESAGVLALCGSYARFVRVLNRSDYDNNMAYLRKSGDLGRRPFPPYLRIVIFSMVLVEAAGLAYVLAGWTLPGASEFAQRVAAGGIGFLIAVILVFFTHWAGVELYHSNQYRRDRRDWVAAGRSGPLYGPDLSLNDDQSVDDHEPSFRQRATRGHGKTSYLLTTITMLMVIAVGCGAAFVRGQVLEQELVLEQAARAKAIQRFDLNAGDSTGEQALADQRVIQDDIAIKRRGGWGTLVVLALIFCFLQLLGIFFGYRYSFNGRLSRDAYRALAADRFSSYSELLQYYDRIADIAQSKVERLQQLIEQRTADGMGSALRLQHYSFRDYLQARDAQRRDKPLGGEPQAPAASHVDAGEDVVYDEAQDDAADEITSAAPAAGQPARGGAPGLAARATDSRDLSIVAMAGGAIPRPAPPANQEPTIPVQTADRFPNANAAANGTPSAPAAPAAATPAAAQGGASTPREQLELAERIERQRAAERSLRGRVGSRRRGPSIAAESEAS